MVITKSQKVQKTFFKNIYKPIFKKLQVPFDNLNNSKKYRIYIFYNLSCKNYQIQRQFHFKEAICQKIFNVLTGRFERWKIERYERQFTAILEKKPL